MHSQFINIPKWQLFTSQVEWTNYTFCSALFIIWYLSFMCHCCFYHHNILSEMTKVSNGELKQSKTFFACSNITSEYLSVFFLFKTSYFVSDWVKLSIKSFFQSSWDEINSSMIHVVQNRRIGFAPCANNQAIEFLPIVPLIGTTLIGCPAHGACQQKFIQHYSDFGPLTPRGRSFDELIKIIN